MLILELNLGLQEKQPLLLTTEMSLQPLLLTLHSGSYFSKKKSLFSFLFIYKNIWNIWQLLDIWWYSVCEPTARLRLLCPLLLHSKGFGNINNILFNFIRFWRFLFVCFLLAGAVCLLHWGLFASCTCNCPFILLDNVTPCDYPTFFKSLWTFYSLLTSPWY